jgi:hypothetical protein
MSSADNAIPLGPSETPSNLLPSSSTFRGFASPLTGARSPRGEEDDRGVGGDGISGERESAQVSPHFFASMIGEFAKVISGTTNKDMGEKRAEKNGAKLAKIQREGLGVLLREAESFRRADELNNGAIVRAIQEATLVGAGETLNDILRRDDGLFEQRLSADCATREARDVAWRSFCISCMDEHEGMGWRLRLREASSMSVTQRSGEKVEDYHNRFKAAWRDSNWKRALVDRVALSVEEASSQFLGGLEASAQLHARDALLMRAPNAVLTVHDIYSIARAHAQNQVDVRRASKRRREPSPRREAPRELRAQAVYTRPRREARANSREGGGYKQQGSRPQRDYNQSRPRQNDRRQNRGDRRQGERRGSDRGRDREQRRSGRTSGGRPLN